MAFDTNTGNEKNPNTIDIGLLKAVMKQINPETLEFYDEKDERFCPVYYNPCVVPEGEAPGSWISTLTDAFCEVYGHILSCREIFWDAAYRAYHDAGVLDGVSEELSRMRSKSVDIPEILKRVRYFQVGFLENTLDPQDTDRPTYREGSTESLINIDLLKAVVRQINPETLDFYTEKDERFSSVRYNPCIIPEDVDPMRWVDALTDAFCRIYNYPLKGYQIFRNAAYYTYVDAGVFEDVSAEKKRMRSKSVDVSAILKKTEYIYESFMNGVLDVQDTDAADTAPDKNENPDNSVDIDLLKAVVKQINPRTLEFYTEKDEEFSPVYYNPCIIPKGVAPWARIPALVEAFCRACGFTLDRDGTPEFCVWFYLYDALYQAYTDAGVFGRIPAELVHMRSGAVDMSEVFKKIRYSQVRFMAETFSRQDKAPASGGDENRKDRLYAEWMKAVVRQINPETLEFHTEKDREFIRAYCGPHILPEGVSPSDWIKRIHLNPCVIPKGATPSDWIMTLTNAFCTAFNHNLKWARLFHAIACHTYREAGVLDDVPEKTARMRSESVNMSKILKNIMCFYTDFMNRVFNPQDANTVTDGGDNQEPDIDIGRLKAVVRQIDPETLEFRTVKGSESDTVRYNPCVIPEGVDPESRISDITDAFCQAYGFLLKGKMKISDAVYRAYTDAGVLGDIPAETARMRSGSVDVSKILKKVRYVHEAFMDRIFNPQNTDTVSDFEENRENTVDIDLLKAVVKRIDPETLEFYSKEYERFNPVCCNPCVIPEGETPWSRLAAVTDAFCRAYGFTEEGERITFFDAAHLAYRDAGVFGDIPAETAHMRSMSVNMAEILKKVCYIHDVFMDRIFNPQDTDAAPKDDDNQKSDIDIAGLKAVVKQIDPETLEFRSGKSSGSDPVRYNPCVIPEGVTPWEWLRVLGGALCEAYGFTEKGSTMLYDAVYHTYKDAGVLDDIPAETARMKSKTVDMAEILKKVRYIHDTLMNRIFNSGDEEALKAGDEVRYGVLTGWRETYPNRGIVIEAVPGSVAVSVVFENGDVKLVNKGSLEKTGRTFTDVADAIIEDVMKNRTCDREKLRRMVSGACIGPRACDRVAPADRDERDSAFPNKKKM